MKTQFRILTALVLLMGIIFGSDFQSRHFKLIKVTDGIYAAIHKPGGSAICNAGIVDMGDYVLVFDTFMTPVAARDLLKAAEELFHKPVKIVVNSHGHSDHVRGNQVFTEAFIIGTEQMREFITLKNKPEEEKGRIDQQINRMKKNIENATDEKKKNELKIWLQYYEDVKASLPELKITLPTISLDKSLVLHGKNITVILHEYPKGHTVSDVVMYVPENGVLFAGDLIFNKMHPYMGDGFPDHWISNLDSLKKYMPAYVVPGHGEVGGPEIIDSMISYFNILKNLAKKMINEGVSSSENIEIPPVPEEIKEYQFEGFYQRNVKKWIDYLLKKQ